MDHGETKKYALAGKCFMKVKSKLQVNILEKLDLY